MLHVLTHILDINLAELQKTLDAQGIELVDNQKESVVGRKALAEKTKGQRTVLSRGFQAKHIPLLLDFKKLPEDEKVNAFKGLLKGMSSPETPHWLISHNILSLPDGD